MAASQTATFRVQKDLKEVASSFFSPTDCPPIFANPVDDRLSHVHAIIVGPSDTPYEHGFYVFDIIFPPTYPNEPPKVRILTNDSGRVRFNPNLYSDGKVCLSILGTWRGETAEVWRSSYSLAYVLQCIQCVIMNGEPFFNEPGFEKDSLLSFAKRLQEGGGVVDAGYLPAPATIAATAAQPFALGGSTSSIAAALANSAPSPAPSTSPAFSATPADATFEANVDAGEAGGPHLAEGADGGALTGPSEAASPLTTSTQESPTMAHAPAPMPPHPAAAGGPLAPSESAPGSAGHIAADASPVGAPANATVPVSPSPGATATAVSIPRRLMWSTDRVHLESLQYSQKIAHENLRVAVCDVLEGLLDLPPISRPQVGAPAAAPSAPSGAAASSSSTLSAAAVPGIVQTFSGEIKLHFMLHYETYLAVAAAGQANAKTANGVPFVRSPFEGGGNMCVGTFAYGWLETRLRRIWTALEEESSGRLEREGGEATRRGLYSAVVMKDEADRITEEFPDVMCGPIDGDVNAFHWRATFLPSDGLLEGSAYVADIRFSVDGDQPPRIRMLQPMYHPNVTSQGVPCLTAVTGTSSGAAAAGGGSSGGGPSSSSGVMSAKVRYGPRATVAALRALMNGRPQQKPECVVNAEAGRLCFSRDEADQRAFKRKARALAVATLENAAY